jgi:hypothetical protein
MRSSDIILGLAYDVPAFTIMQEVMANELGVELGEYVHTSNSLHCYQRDFEMLNEIANSEVTYNEPMRKLSGSFPTDEMMKMEELTSSATNSQLMTGALFVSPPFTKNLNSTNLDLVHDWFRVLLARRLRKLQENEMAEFTLAHASDGCYKFFNR